MNFNRNGYTLIEIVVVTTLIGLMLFFTLPRFQSAFFSGDAKDVTRWIILKVKALKESAVIEQNTYILHFDTDSARAWITHEKMTDEEIAQAKQNEFVFPKSIQVVDIEYPGIGTLSNGEGEICFYPKGYSDKAIIHLVKADNEYTSYIIEPFLPKVKVVNHYYKFES